VTEPRTGLIAHHDGTEYFAIPFQGRAGVVDVVCYLPVPGGVVMVVNDTSPVLVPMCRLEYDLDEGGLPINVHLTSTMPQVMMGAMAMAGAAQQLMEDGG